MRITPLQTKQQNMFTNNKYPLVIIVLFSLCLTGVTAQDDVDRNVTVERDFQPIVEDAGKIITLPEVLELTKRKQRVDYSEIDQPLPFIKSIFPLSSQDPLIQSESKQIGGFVRLGMGNYWNTLGDVVLPIINNTTNRLDLILKHTATFGSKQHSVSQGNLEFNHFFNNYDLYAGVNMSHESFYYYGNNFNASGDVFDLRGLAFNSTENPDYTELDLERITRLPLTVSLFDLAKSSYTDVLWRYNAHVGIRSLPTAVGHKYAGEVSYDMFRSINGLDEHTITTKYGFSNPLGANRIGMDFNLSNMFYRQHNLLALNFWDYYAVFSMNPYYLIERDEWYLRAGVKTAFSFIHGRPFNPMPDVSAEWRVLPKNLAFYGGVTGSFTPSTLTSIYKENPYVYPDLRVKDTYVPVNPFFGFKLKPMHNLLFDASVDYRYIKDQYFFVNKGYHSTQIGGDLATVYTNHFNAIYSDVDLIRYSARMNYHFKDIVNVQLKGMYNDWRVETQKYAWMKPAIEAEFSTDVRVYEYLTLGTTIFYEGKCYAKLDDTLINEMPSKLDVNLSATYAFDRTFSLFIKANNLLNSNYQRFYGYDVQGVNFLVGGAISF